MCHSCERVECNGECYRDDTTNNRIPTSGSIYDPARIDSTKALAKRDAKGPRMDLLVPDFLEAMGEIGKYGAEHYGEGNWHRSRLELGHGPVNHILQHVMKYQQHIPYDHPEIGIARRYHLAAIAFNAMMEWWYESHFS